MLIFQYIYRFILLKLDANLTSNTLEIKDLIVDNIKTSSTDIHLPLKNVPCLFYNHITNKIHDYRYSIIKTTLTQGKFLFLHYKKRHYHFNNYSHYFNESFFLLPKYYHIITSLSFLAIHQLNEFQNISSATR